MNRCLGRLMEELTEQFKFKNPKHSIHCFSLVCWQNGYWSISITDDWHKWIDAKIDMPNDLWETPEAAVEGFLEFVRVNKIKLSELQSDD